MLTRFQADAARAILAEVQEAADAVSKLGESAILGVADSGWHGEAIYRDTIYPSIAPGGRCDLVKEIAAKDAQKNAVEAEGPDECASAKGPRNVVVDLARSSGGVALGSAAEALTMGRILSRAAASVFALALVGCSSSGGGGFVVDGGTDGSSGGSTSGGSGGSSSGGFAGSSTGGSSFGGSAGSSFGGSAGSSFGGSAGSSFGGSGGSTGGTGGFGGGGTGGVGGGGTGGTGDGGPFQCITISTLTNCTAPNQATCTCGGCKNINCQNETELSDCVCPECATDTFCSDTTKCNHDNICDPFNEGCICSDCANHPLC